MRANRDPERLMREHTADNRRRFKFWRCDISAEEGSGRAARITASGGGREPSDENDAVERPPWGG